MNPVLQLELQDSRRQMLRSAFLIQVAMFAAAAALSVLTPAVARERLDERVAAPTVAPSVVDLDDEEAVVAALASLEVDALRDISTGRDGREVALARLLPGLACAVGLTLGSVAAARWRSDAGPDVAALTPATPLQLLRPRLVVSLLEAGVTTVWETLLIAFVCVGLAVGSLEHIVVTSLCLLALNSAAAALGVLIGRAGAGRAAEAVIGLAIAGPVVVASVVLDPTGRLAAPGWMALLPVSGPAASLRNAWLAVERPQLGSVFVLLLAAAVPLTIWLLLERRLSGDEPAQQGHLGGVAAAATDRAGE